MTVPTKLKNHGLLSPGEVAERTGRHRSTIWQWMEWPAGGGKPLLPSYFVDDADRLILFKKGMDRPHYRGVRPEDITAWHRAGGVSRDGSASDTRSKTKVKTKATTSRKQRKRPTKKR